MDEISRLVLEYAQRRYFDRLARAVVRGVISEDQAQSLMEMWREDHADDD